MTDRLGSDGDEVVSHTFVHDCGTTFVCNRAEPFCLADHPGQWHLQSVDAPREPCERCLVLIDNFVGYAKYIEAHPETELTILYPPPGETS